jgi:cytidylate kinase
MIITIAGLPGSGKTTIAALLSKRLGVPWYSIGDLRGKMAAERGMTIDELNKLGEKLAFTDHEVDEYQKKLGERGEACIIEGRLSWYFIPNSFKVFLDVNPEVGAKRVLESSRGKERPDERRYRNLDEAREHIQYRLASDQQRYQKYYGVDVMNRSNYDFVLDTTDLAPEAIVETLVKKANV